MFVVVFGCICLLAIASALTKKGKPDCKKYWTEH